MSTVTDERLPPMNIIRRCVMDYVRRGGIFEESDATDVAASVIGCLDIFGYEIKEKRETK